ncbi:MAG: hypothetical protein P4L35_10930 [Ignavibacteriaceae bacterium]|nr:hypothetical protein [Ignavibacteriaceae bacterium]
MAYQPTLEDFEVVERELATEEAKHNPSKTYQPTIADFEAVEQELGESEPKRKGFSGVKEDIAESLMGLPGAILDMLKELPGEAYGTGKQIATDPLRAALNAAVGLKQGIRGAINLPGNVGRYAKSREIPYAQGLARIPELKAMDENALLGLGETQKGDALIRALTGMGPYGKLGATKGLATYAVGQNEDPLQAAIIGELGPRLAKGAKNQLSKLKPSNMLRGNLSPEELVKNLEITKGTNTQLGEVLESPKLKTLMENILAETMGTGAAEKLQETGRQVTSKGENILKDMEMGYNPKDASLLLQDALKKSYDETRKAKDQRYDILNKEANAAGIEIGRHNLGNVAKEKLKEINKSPELRREMSSSFLNDLNIYAKETGVQTFNKKRPEKDLKTSNLFRGKLGDKANEAFDQKRKFEGQIYKDLQRALEKDINYSIEKSGNPHIQELNKEANRFYKEEYLPFEDKKITQFTKKGGDIDTLINQFIPNSRVNDRSNLLNKLMEKLPEDKKSLVPLAYFSRASRSGTFDPNAFKTLFKQLGPQTKDVLLQNPNLKKTLEDYATLVSKNTEPLSVMVNPKTGKRVNTMLGMVGTSLAGAGLAGLPGALYGMGLGLGAPAILGKYLTKKLTSEPFRENLVNKMIGKAKTDKFLNPEEAKALKKALSKTGRASISASQEKERNL